MESLAIFLISLIANIFSAFAGGGAGLIQLPALIFLGLPFGVALATHKLASVALGLGATLRHIKESRFQQRFILLMLSSGLPGVILGANTILAIPESMAQFSLGCLTIMLGSYSIYKKDLGQTITVQNRSLNGFLIGGLGLFMLGFLNGSLTSGTGLFVTLWLIRWFGLDYKTAVAYTLVLVGLFWNGTGALTLGLQGQIYWQWIPALLVGSLLGGYIGAHLGIKKGNRWIKRGFEIITIFVGISLIINVY
ncbi:MAG TPA: sulfite exporter TauE/SafE family protein [Thiothrix sp.]|nr:sulfite exporter TauE/SafE family protein [Thiothrix sp.]